MNYFVFTKAGLEAFKRSGRQDSDKYRNIKINDGKFYRVDGLKTKQIIAQEDIRNVLKSIYADPETGFRSLDKFWDHVREHYEGIGKEDVLRFLSNNETAQIQKPVRENKVNRPIVTSNVNQLYQIDLADVSKYASMNNGINFLFVAIDAFSKFATVMPIKTKDEKTVAAAIEETFKAMGTPSRIQHDNGSEFVNKTVKQLCEDYEVKQIVSAPYHPRSNGIVERFNRTLKNIIAKFMVNFNTKHFIDVLPKLIKNYNDQIHTTTKRKPDEVVNAADSKNEDDIQTIKEVKEEIEDKALDSVATRNDAPDLRQGDYVRLSQLTNAAIRKKKTFRKSYEKQWSDEIYRIAYVNVPKKSYMPHEYWILDYEAGKVLDKKFYRDQLQLIDPETLIKTIPNANRPEFNKAIFNRERHLKNMKKKEKEIEKEIEEEKDDIPENKDDIPESRPIRQSRKPIGKKEKQYVREMLGDNLFRFNRK